MRRRRTDGPQSRKIAEIELGLEVLMMLRTDRALVLELMAEQDRAAGLAPDTAEHLEFAMLLENQCLSLEIIGEICHCTRAALWQRMDAGLNKMRTLAERKSL